MFDFDDVSRKSRETMDGVLKSYTDVTRGFQAIASEASDYSRRSLQDMTTYAEAFTSVRSVEAACELQADYLKASYEGFVAQATRIGDLYADLAKTAYKPFEAPSAQQSTAIVPVNGA